MPVFRTGPLPPSARTTGLSATVDAAGALSGEAAPGAVIEVQNLSVAPTTGQLVGDGVDVVVAGADGRFSAVVNGALPGDVLQVQVRGKDASVPAAVQLRVDATRAQFDPRAAYVHLGRLRVDDDGARSGRGVLSITSRTRMPVSEPDATIRFTNRRSGVFVDVVVDPRGLVGVVALDGNAGDIVDVAVSDGSGNLDFKTLSGSLTSTKPVPSTPQPQLRDRGLTARTLRGPLISPTGPGYGFQGRIGDCPVPAACSAVAAVDEQAIRDLIRPQRDGTYVVTFHPQNQPPVEIVVDDKVWQDANGPRYGTGKIETWFPLVEKAYAAYVGGYEILGQGTSVGTVLSELVGRPVTEVWLNTGVKADDVWKQVQRATAQGQAMALGTFGSSEQARYRGTGVYPNHAYSVVGVAETNGVRHLILRNPWGSSAGVSSGVTGSARVDGGVFSMKIDDVVDLFQVLNIA